MPKVRLRRRSDGTVRTYDVAFVKANPAKFKNWDEVPADTKGPPAGAKPAKKAPKVEAVEDDAPAADEGDSQSDAEEVATAKPRRRKKAAAEE